MDIESQDIEQQIDKMIEKVSNLIYLEDYTAVDSLSDLVDIEKGLHKIKKDFVEYRTAVDNSYPPL